MTFKRKVDQRRKIRPTATAPRSPVRRQGRPWDFNGTLQSLSNLAQVGLLVLAVIGYFYTVKPVFEKELLVEDKAKLEIENKKATTRLNDLVAEQEQVRRDTEVLLEQLAEARLQAEDLAESARSAQRKVEAITRDGRAAAIRERDASARAGKVERLYREHLEALDDAQWKLLVVDFAINVADLRTAAINERSSDAANLSQTRLDPIALAEKHWPDTKATLDSAVSELKAMPRFGSDPNQIVELDRRLTEIGTRRICPRPDVSGQRENFELEMEGAWKDAEKQVDKMRAEMLGASEQARAVQASRIRLTFVRHVYDKFDWELSALASECDKLLNEIIAELRPRRVR